MATVCHRGLPRYFCWPPCTPCDKFHPFLQKATAIYGIAFYLYSMKNVFIILICLLFARVALAQKDSLATDEHNKYIYYHVVAMPGLPTDTLQARALYFLRSAYPENKIKRAEVSGNFTGDSKFLILTGITAAKHVDGEIDYTYFIECKDQKYRYWLTDFVFRPYKVDRYGNPVPEQGIYIPLESGLSRLYAKELETYLNQTGNVCREFGGKLKKYMINASVAPSIDERKKIITTKDW